MRRNNQVVSNGKDKMFIIERIKERENIWPMPVNGNRATCTDAFGYQKNKG